MQRTTQNPVTNWLVNHRHEAIELLRIFIGILLIYKGYVFVEELDEIYSMIEEAVHISSFVVAHYVVGAHLVGGIMIAFGLKTRLAVAIQIPILIGAVFLVHARDLFLVTATEFEYSLLFLVLLVVFLIYGGGKWSVDHQIIRRKEV